MTLEAVEPPITVPITARSQHRGRREAVEGSARWSRSCSFGRYAGCRYIRYYTIDNNQKSPRFKIHRRFPAGDKLVTHHDVRARRRKRLASVARSLASAVHPPWITVSHWSLTAVLKQLSQRLSQACTSPVWPVHSTAPVSTHVNGERRARGCM